jgi:hypothetical protein
MLDVEFSAPLHQYYIFFKSKYEDLYTKFIFNNMTPNKGKQKPEDL